MVSEQDIINAIGHEHPNLAIGNFQHTSDETSDYNCIAWAAMDTQKMWWPGLFYWPIPRFDESVENFKEAFKSRGFKLGKGLGKPTKVERLAFYCSGTSPKHAARQLQNGEWSSKLGPKWDISHQLSALEGGIYGSVAFYMHRPRK